MSFSYIRPRVRIAIFAALALALFALSMYRSYALGQYRTMYDNPIYRWRESTAVALSQMRDPPLHGYVAYRSIRDYLNHHGLALMEGEAAPLPTPAELHALIYDPDRLEQLFRSAAVTPIDPALPQVPIAGNEKGEADFYHFAFSIFGIGLSALWKFYFLLLFTSASAFFIAFYSSSRGIVVLLLYLAAHLVMVGVAAAPWLQTVHNSRFFPVLALLPSLHLLLLVLRRERFAPLTASLATAQTVLLFFLIFCRFQAIWQPLAVIAAGIMLSPREIATRLWWPRKRGHAVGSLLMMLWPAGLVGIGVVSLSIYQYLALDSHAYAQETRTHTVWEPVFSGTVSADAKLCKLYCFGQEPYSDSIGYMAALDYLRRRNDTNSPIAHVENGQILINAMWNMGVYDTIIRNIFVDVARHHPWLVVKSFVFDKPYDQLEIVINGNLINSARLAMTLALGMGIGILILLARQEDNMHEPSLRSVIGGAIFVVFSLATTEITPNIIIPDTVAVFLLLVSLAGFSIPFTLVSIIKQLKTQAASNVSPSPTEIHE